MAETINKVAEKFIMNENDKNAELYFNKKVEKSANDVIAGVHDTIHKIAVYFK